MWYSEQITQQLEGQDAETADLELVDLSMGMIKEIGAKWFVDTANYIGDNPQFIVNGFIYAGIAKALDSENLNDSSSELSASEAIATTTSEESDDNDEDNAVIDFIVL